MGNDFISRCIYTEEWIGLIWLRIGTSGGALVNTIMNLWVP
jgi:hypothetical protein